MRCTLSLALLALTATAVHAQYPAPLVPVIPPPLYVRFAGPPGMVVTVYRGGPQGQAVEAPCTLALRPGYSYRVQIGGMADHPGLTVYPTLEVLGSLRLPTVQAARHPATLTFSDEDFARIRAGAVVTKVVLLERPETALPTPTQADRPIEISLPPDRDPMVAAAAYGRPLLMLHMGQREMTPQELAYQGVPGTVQMPSEKVMPAPRDPPFLPWMCYPLGQSSPADEMCFHDGGDGGLEAGVDAEGKLRGVDPSDTVAKFTDHKGNSRVAVSNRVCLCVPRFLVLRTEISTASNTVRAGTGDTRLAQGPGATHADSGPGQLQLHQTLAEYDSKTRPSAVLNTLRTSVTGQFQGLSITSNWRDTGHVTAACAGPPEQAEPTGKPLVIIKWPDKCDPLIGEVVTFFIKYKNQGAQPISGIVVTDSLTTRLEYVPGSARADRDGLFTTTPNEAGSQLLRWEITGALPPGQSGVVSFQARVR